MTHTYYFVNFVTHTHTHSPYRGPVHPAGQRHLPLTGLQATSRRQLHSFSQLWPHVPCGHSATEISFPYLCSDYITHVNLYTGKSLNNAPLLIAASTSIVYIHEYARKFMARESSCNPFRLLERPLIVARARDRRNTTRECVALVFLFVSDYYMSLT